MRVVYMYIHECRCCYSIFRNVPDRNVNKVIIHGTFNDWLERMVENSHKKRTKIAIGNFIGKLEEADI